MMRLLYCWDWRQGREWRRRRKRGLTCDRSMGMVRSQENSKNFTEGWIYIVQYDIIGASKNMFTKGRG